MHAPLPTTVLTDVAVAHGDIHRISFDIETRSCLDIRKVGAARYAADPSTQVLCVAYAVDDGPVQLWLPDDPVVPPVIVEAAPNPNWDFYAHNAQFEYLIVRHVLHARHSWPSIPIEKFRCTQAMGLALGMPAKLSALADALELEHRKDSAGEKLMSQTSRPRKSRKKEDPAKGPYWYDDDDRLQRLYPYCKQDTEVLRELANRLPPLSPAEQRAWELSNQINERGFHVDRQFAEAARRIAQAAAPEIDAELAELTSCDVTSINQVARLLQWLQEQGCTATTLARKTVERLLDQEDLPRPVHRVLQLRCDGAQAAVKKTHALLARASEGDDRVRGAFKYHGAATGRWSGEGFQPQNLKRPVVKDLDAAYAAVATGDYAHVKKLYPRLLEVVGDCTRSMIDAGPGHTLIGGDFNAIESRVLAWVAGENWKLDSYRRYNATRDPCDEPYCVTACKIFRVPDGSYTKDSPERAVGKVCDLAFGYQGGLNAWRNFEPNKFTDDEVQQFKREWRAAHPATVKFWHDIDRAAAIAVCERGRIVRCGRVDLKSTGSFLQIRLPSKRKLSYPQPRIIEDKHGKPRVSFTDNAAGQFKDCRHGQGAYGGMWAENLVSGIARDVLVEAMLRIEAAGYPIVLHVHDEIVAEVPIGFGSTEEFIHLMTRKPAWALELPIAASAWTGPRYCK